MYFQWAKLVSSLIALFSLRLNCRLIYMYLFFILFLFSENHVLNQFKPSSKNILLTFPRRYFFCGSFMFLFCLVFAMSLCASILYVLIGHLLGKG